MSHTGERGPEGPMGIDYDIKSCPLNIVKTEEAGYKSAMLGLSLSYEVKDLSKMDKTAYRLCDKDGGHNKFLEMIQVWFDVTLPRGLWQQYDTYRTGTTKQSGSTMHTILKKELTQTDFYLPIYPLTLDRLNSLITGKEFDKLKNELPEGYLQRRVVNTNYKVLRNIFMQRHDHKWGLWYHVCRAMWAQLEHPELLRTCFEKKNHT